MNGNSKDDFWDLEKYIKKDKNAGLTPKKSYSAGDTSAVEIGSVVPSEHITANTVFEDSRISRNENGEITRFIPPHRDPKSLPRYIINEYVPENPLIKSVRVYSDKPDDKVFVESNLFIRERAALLEREAKEQSPVPFYSYSPRYSQLSGSQLRWYLWWRENARQGNFMKTDEAYIILYAYELASAGENEDKQASLDKLCSIISAYSDRDLSVVMKMMIRDLICDFCLLHGLDFPVKNLKSIRPLISSSSFPEFFLDLSPERRAESISIAGPSLSLYDYKRSKFYNEQTAKIFKESIRGALMAVANHEKAFAAMTSFTEGVYGSVIDERHPFGRMVNIVNKNIKLEITYFQISNIKIAVTDTIRCAEKRLREHLGIKNKLHISSVNPYIKEAVDNFFDENYPAIPTVDRRRKENKAREEQEYEKLYDIPKVEISPERAIMIEQESWDTTKILTEAFAEEQGDNDICAAQIDSDNAKEIFISQETYSSDDTVIGNDTGDTMSQLRAALGKKAELITLCKSGQLTDQRSFARSLGISLDELADTINETAVEVLGDIILEYDGEAYRIIEDYLFLF